MNAPMTAEKPRLWEVHDFHELESVLMDLAGAAEAMRELTEQTVNEVKVLRDHGRHLAIPDKALWYVVHELVGLSQQAKVALYGPEDDEEAEQ